jgi:hypothetical protein
MVCCPEEIPENCQPGSWEFSPHSGDYGCCSQDLEMAVGCWEGYYAEDCGWAECVFHDSWGGWVGCENW